MSLGGGFSNFLIWVVLQAAFFGVPAFLIYMAWRFLRAYESRKNAPADGRTESRISQLEDAVVRMQAELTRIGDEQEFVRRLLEKRNERAGVD